jgi:class 3 adenylate cyclase
MECPKCRRQNPDNAKFCNECGSSLPEVKPNEDVISTTTSERKQVTMLFSDLTGYTAMAEKLDPEEVKEITSRIFSEISKIVSSYNGFIEKYAGDAVMAIFGVPKTHEDDPIRAVRAAGKIHELVKEVSPEVEKKIGQAISMHTGITTGLVVTGEVDMARGTHGIVGDTINLASRLSNLAKPGEILVNADTYRQVEGHFTCEYRETATVKGKADPVDFYQVLSQRDRPLTIHRLSGLRADMIVRDKELAELSDAVENLRIGEGRIISIRGAAGTGKSRLVEEFKAGIDYSA